MRAKAAESLCAGCLTKSKESCHTRKQNTSGTLTDRENAERSPLCEKPKVYAEMPAVPQEGKERL